MTTYVKVPIEPSINGEKCAEWCGFLNRNSDPCRCRLFGVPLKCANPLGDMWRAQACIDAEVPQ
jgi:hypothetical protein